MKTRGTRGGILLSLEPSDSPELLSAFNEEQNLLLSNKVTVELSDKAPWSLLEALAAKVKENGGEIDTVRPPSSVIRTKGETVIIAKTIRGGGLVESTGSLIILGDVNAGAELIAEDDIIVIGSLRGVAHAGATGNEQAVIWAQKILSPQLRIAGQLAQAGSDSPSEAKTAEVAHLKDGQIVIRPWDK
ncbi:MAG: septum site-determining protein MinC [Trueperaceae bacterium]